MWVARNKTGELCLFTGATPPVRNKPLEHPRSLYWGYNMNSDDDIIPLYKNIVDEFYNNSVFEEMFKNLKWKDDPIEVVMHERFPVNEITCLDCGTRFKYTAKDVESFTYEECEDLWNAGVFGRGDCVKCPDCGKYVIISHY